ncbi:MAG: hypothetical protein ABW051_06200 [Burkholderiaceae bacterium]
MVLRCAFLLAFAAFAVQGAGAAEPTDRLDTPACKVARLGLEQMLESRAPSAGQLEAAKKRTAEACFGSARNPSSSAGRVAQPPVAVPPPATAIRPVQPPAAPLPPVAIPRPSTVTSCDAGGCWDSNGARLNRIGPGLSATTGPCTVQGAFAYCP